MPDKNEVLCFLGGVASGVVLTKLIHPMAEDDRPVIVVSGGSITAHHEKKWKRHGADNRVWEVDYNRGGMTIYVVKVTKPTGHNAMVGVNVTFVYQPEVGIQTTLTFGIETDSSGVQAPFLRSTSDLRPRDLRKKVAIESDGRISSVQVQGHASIAFPEEVELWMF